MRRVGVVCVLMLATSLGVPGPHGVAAGPTTPAGDVTVFAASSLSDPFAVIAKQFEAKYPGTHVTLKFDSSTTLASQIEFRVHADVFASADMATMGRLEDSGHVNPGYGVVARNRMQIAVAPRNPKRIRTLADTLKRSINLVTCVFDAPCGKYARLVYGRAHLSIPDVATGRNAKDTINRVIAGTADAAIVYVTDVKAAQRDVDRVRIPNGVNVIARYPIAPLIGTTNPVAARAFVLFVRSKAGQRILRRFGFMRP